MKTISASILFISIGLLAGCTTNVAVDPAGKEIGSYSSLTGTFYGAINAELEASFLATIKAVDSEAPTRSRTREINRPDKKVVYVRVVGDDEVIVTLTPRKDGVTNVSIAWGTFGDLPKSQNLFNKIRASF